MKFLNYIFPIAAAFCVSVAASAQTTADFIKKFEGYRATAYTCAAGKKTIGYGFTDASVVAKGRITKAEADKELTRLCNSIAAKVRSEVAKGKGKPLTAKEETAIVSFVYNVGWHNFKRSTLLRLLKQGKRGAAIGAELRKWKYVTANGRKTVSKGLAKRRNAEAAMFGA